MFLTYGRDHQDNLIHILDVQSGNGCGLFCPFCKGALTARKGNILAHHFAHQQESCRPVTLGFGESIPSYEGYFLLGLTKAQQRAMHTILATYGYQSFYACEIKWMLVQSLTAKRLLTLRHQPDEREQIQEVVRATDKAKAFACQLSLTEFAYFMRNEFERVHRDWSEGADSSETQVALSILNREMERLQQTQLYFIRLMTETTPLYKIGITTRTVGERLAEIVADVRQYRVVGETEVLFSLWGVSYVEGYFKSKYAAYQQEMGKTTEYFAFDEITPIEAELNDLAQAVEAGFPQPQAVLQNRTNNEEGRNRFQATFERHHHRRNLFAPRGYEHLILLVDLLNLDTGQPVAEWQYFTCGKGFDALKPLQKGDVLEFDAKLENGQVKRPTKLIKVT